MLRRLPIRLRVTLASAAAMALLLTLLSVFLVLRLGVQLDAAIDQGLRSRAADISELVRTEGGGIPVRPRGSLDDDDSRITQLLGRRGQIIDATPRSLHRPLLSPAQFARARQKPLTFDATIGSEHSMTRLFATVTSRPDVVVVVGQGRETRDEAVQQLKNQLGVGVPIALIVACLVGYLATARALAPVRAMTRQTRAIETSSDSTGMRLTVPSGNDEIADLGRTLNAMLDRLAASLRRERAFVADASHELRTPLAIMSAEIQVALDVARDASVYRDALTSLDAQSARVVRLADDLLILARADQGRLPVRLEPLDVATAVADSAARFDARIAQAELHMDVTTDADLFVAADELRFGQLLDNLVENALRHARTTISVSARRMDGTIVVRIADDGLGFPLQFVARAFDRFAVADESRTDGHSGLGLSIVRVIADAHHATVAIVASDAGAVIELCIPELVY